MVDVENPQLFERVNKFLGRDNTQFWSLFQTIEELLKVGEKQQQEYATLSESITEDDVIIAQLQEEIEQKQKVIGQYQLQESLLLERLKKQTLLIKEMKQNSRLQRFYSMAEENLRLAQEVARLKGVLPV